MRLTKQKQLKILLINNHTEHLVELNEALSDHLVEIQNYEPGIIFHDWDKDLIILSGGGGEGLEIYDKAKKGRLWYADQMEFISRTKKPVLGICMGFEVIASTFGSKVEQLPALINGILSVETTEKGSKFLGHKTLHQYEAHRWRVPEVSDEFEVLAQSDTGIEVIRHKTRPILATQFHPEVPGGTLSLSKLISSFSS